MSDRERWVVYPLLFLAMGASLRDKLFDRTMSKTIGCQELIVYGEDSGGLDPPKLVVIGAAKRSSPEAPQSGLILVDGQLLVDQLRVGTVVADNYGYRGIPFTPTLRAILPGVSPAELLRAFQQSAEAMQDGTTPAPPEKPSAEQQGGQQPPSGDRYQQSPTQQPSDGDSN